jgi:hypothetical protein
MTTRKAVEMATEKGVGDKHGDSGSDPTSDARGPRDDGTSKVPDRQLDIRSR